MTRIVSFYSTSQRMMCFWKMCAIISVLVFQYAGIIACKEVLVSSVNSSDAVNCGLASIPCKSLSYVINNIVENHDIINIDGGNARKPIRYYVTNMNLTKSVQIKRLNSSSHNPILVKLNQAPDLPLFNVFQNNYLNITSIDFVDLNLAVYKNTYGISLILRNCSITVKSNYPFVYLNFDLYLRYTSFIRITNCTITHSKNFLYSNGNSNVAVSAKRAFTFLSSENTSYPISNRNPSLIISNATFKDFDSAAVKVKDSIDHLLMANVHFNNCTVGVSGTAVNVTFNSCAFHGTPIILKNSVGDFYNTSFVDIAKDNVLLFTKCQIKFTNCSFFNLTGYTTGPVWMLLSFVEIYFCSFIHNKNMRYSGALYTINSSVLICHSHFIKNEGNNGGAIQSVMSKFVILHSFFKNNTAVNDGGAIYIIDSKLSTKGTVFDENFAAGNGGAVYGNGSKSLVTSSDVEVNKCNFTQNKAKNGGAINVRAMGILLHSTIIIANTAIKTGGGLIAKKVNIVLERIQLIGNTADNSAASYFVESTLNVTSTVVIDNRAENHWGNIMYVDQSYVYMQDCQLKNNSGIPLYISYNDVVIVNSTWFIGNKGVSAATYIYKNINVFLTFCHFQNNVGLGYGTVHVTDTDHMSLANSSFTENQAQIISGILLWNTSFTIANMIFKYNVGNRGTSLTSIHCNNSKIHSILVTDNKATDAGSGLRILKSNVNIVNATIKNNKASWGAGLIIKKSSVVLSDSVFSENQADFAGGIHISGSNVSISSTELIDNVARDDPSALYFNGMSKTQSALYLSNMKIIGAKSPVIGVMWIYAPHNKNLDLLIRNVSISLQSSQCGVRSISIISSAEVGDVDFTYTCPVGHNPIDTRVIEFDWNTNHNNYLYTFYCTACPRGFYSLQKGRDHVIVLPFKRVSRKRNNVTCHQCPPGSNCEGTIKSRDNFWAFEKGERNEILEFLPCPISYCCNQYGKECTNCTTCNHNREGFICGECSRGYYLSYFSNDCISKQHCKDKVTFWIMYISYAAIYTFIITFLKEISFYTKYYFLKLKSSLQHKLKQVKSQPSTDLINCLTMEDNVDCINNEGFLIVETYPTEDDVLTVFTANSQFMKESSKVSGIFKTLVFYYQVKALITVELNEEINSFSGLDATLTSIFNLQLPLKKACPTNSLDVISKAFIKDPLFIATMLVFLLIGNGCVKLCKVHNKRMHNTKYCKAFLMKLRRSTIQILLLGYIVLATFCLTMIKCQKLKNVNVLYVGGNVVCYTWWQSMTIWFLIFWIIPFPFALYFVLNMLKLRQLTITQFFVCIFIPLLTLYYRIKFRCSANQVHPKYSTEIENLNAMFEEPYRYDTNGQPISWDSYRLFQRFLIAAFTTFCIDPIMRMSFILPIMLLSLVVHLLVKPYKNRLVNWLETSTLVSLCFLVGVNMFRAFFYVYALPYDTSMVMALYVFRVVEFFCNPLIVVMFVTVGRKVGTLLLKHFINKLH